MNKPQALLLAAIGCLLPGLAPLRAPAQEQQAGPKPPNIVVFLSDDHTWRDSSVYGSPDIETPNMARLAETGMTFDKAYVASPSCAPSRAALLTGLYPANNGAEPNHSRPDRDIKKLPAYLRELGYEVVSFGKVGHYLQTPEYGFDIARHFRYHEDIAIPEALEWLRERKSDQPLCLFVGTNWPHVPWPEDPEGIEPGDVKIPPNHVRNAVTKKWRARYTAAVRTMDKELGQVFDLAREKFGDDLFFLHTSDHGAQWPFGKWNLYEDGVRTPLLASWPGKIPSGVRTGAMVSWIDILPTLVEAAGGEAPQDIDGRSFLPVLTGEKEEHRDIVLTTHSGDGNYNVYPIRAAHGPDGLKYIRNLRPDLSFRSHVTSAKNSGDSGYWDSWVDKAVKNPEARRKVRNYMRRPAEELYQTDEDPWERNNLIGDPDFSERAGELRQDVDEWMEETGDEKALYGTPIARTEPGPEHPNIISVFIDDMGWSDLSCFGGDTVETEHIDRLAAEGIKFTQFYVNSPICSPSRTALTTGQWPQRWGITSYLAFRKQNTKRGMAQWLDPEAPVLARELQANGYATGHYGKWHMGGQRDVDDAPLITDYGFDRSLTNFEGMGAKLLPLTLTPESDEPGRIWEDAVNLGKPVTWMQRSEITAGFVDGALGFIDRAGATGQPFFVNVWPDDVHSPFFPPLERWGEGGKRELYNGVLDTMDEQLGVLFDRIRDDEKLRDNTLIVLCSDNGHEPGAGTSDPLRGAKTWTFEGGVRSPLIVWGPGLLAEGTAGTTNEESVFSAIDINRSLYTVTNTPLPEGHELDGEDLSDTLLGKAKDSREAPIFFRRPPDRPGDHPKWGMGNNPDLAVRHSKWKYLTNYDGSDPQLYDLVDDIAESRNLVEEHPEVAEKLKKALFEWNDSVPPDAGDPEYGQKTAAKPLPGDQFVNPVGEGADPWVIRDPTEAGEGRYLWCFSEGNRAIAVHTSDRLTSLGEKHIVWTAPDEGPVSRQVWAPELHFLDGKWHIYFAASDGENINHLAYVLVSEDNDPLGDYALHGPFATGDEPGEPLWAIDMTVLEHGGKRYALWSGHPERGSDNQFLYAAEMESPTELATSRVRIASNDDYPWEFTENRGKGRGLNEAPQVLDHEGRTFVLYSCGASWLPTYKVALLELTGRDPLDPDAWVKRKKPVFTSSKSTFGVGHSCFVPSPDGSELWHVYHAKRDRDPGWRRAVHLQPFGFPNHRGLPVFGKPVAPGVPLDRPAGEPPLDAASLPLTDALGTPGAWSYYGHHQFYTWEKDGLRLGRVPGHKVNAYRSGEKALLDRRVPADARIEVTIDFRDGSKSRDAGILFRTTAPSVGHDAQRGYFAGLVPKTGLLVLGKTDGESWTEIARAKTDIDPGKPQQLRVELRGPAIAVFHNGAEEPALTAEDHSWSEGQVGLRVVGTHAVFSELRMAAEPE